MDGVQQLAHDRAQSLHGQLAHVGEVLEIRLDVLVVLNGVHGGHVKGGTDVAVPRLRYPRLFVDAEASRGMRNGHDGFCKPVAFVLCKTQHPTLGSKHC